MDEISLNGVWQFRAQSGSEWLPARVPGSVYSDLLANGRIPDPYFRDNEDAILPLMDEDYVYQRAFTLTKEQLEADGVILHCQGLDTLAEVFLNGKPLGRADNMHRTWDFDIKTVARAGENTLEVLFFSPTKFVADAFERCPAIGSSDAMRGFSHLRKAHCMFGWDWGPRLPDAGIWRDISVQLVDTARLTSLHIRQKHDGGRVTLSFSSDVDALREAELTTRVRLTSPDGDVLETTSDTLTVENPKLWWPNGYGGQPLYAVEAQLICDWRVIDVWQGRIGLRTLTVKNESDSWGESFEFVVNGVSVFAMGGDYIPEDNLRSRITPERTRRLLEDCALANHNSIRVWGGGYYPDDWFYDACDEMGIIVWQDCMFACATYDLSIEMAENIQKELIDNVRRLRHHASLGLWCANNELEWQVDTREYKPTKKHVADYIRLFEYLIPNTLRKLDPDTFFWPSSPSSGGGFDEPNDPDRGDVHYWDVWHRDKPFPEYRKFFFRFASEFGFQSFPCLKTVESFTVSHDRDVFSYVMEKHQRNKSANGKIMNYLSQVYRYPRDFDHLLYASQLLQMDAIRYGVEHWRRNRGRCMGAIYWQVNDCWPVASWSSIDYYGRWKALHYASKRFFAPVLISCEEEGTLSQETNVNAQGIDIKKSARLNVSNETVNPVEAKVTWSLRDANGEILSCGEQIVRAEALTSVWLPDMNFPQARLHGDYFAYDMYIGDVWISGDTALFCAPKHFDFVDPRLTVEPAPGGVVIKAHAYAKSVEIQCDGDVLFKDNYFDMNPGERFIKILRGEGSRFTARSVFDISASRR